MAALPPSMRAVRRLLAAIAAAALPALAAAGPLAGAGIRAAPDAVSVADGRTLLKACRPWSPRGLSFFGRIVPTGWATDPETTAAQRDFSPWTVQAVRALGGDTMRLQVGMPFLDPDSPQARPDYLGELREAVAMARGAGLTVILSMQWEERTHVPPVEKTPQGSALRAWRRLAPAFAGDLGVVYELFNEPNGTADPPPEAWELWRSGHQAIIDDLRKSGIRNTLLVDGIHFGRILEGAPELHDPLGRLAYAVHPYLAGDMHTPAQWDKHFGRFAQTHAVVATEWSHFAQMCKLADGAVAEQLLEYLADRRIGMIGYGADERMGRVMARDGGRLVINNFHDHPCEGLHSGPGEALQRMFARLAQADARAPQVAPEACRVP